MVDKSLCKQFEVYSKLSSRFQGTITDLSTAKLLEIMH